MSTSRVTVSAAFAANISDDQLCEFYARHWARPIALTRSDFMAWQMRDAPDAKGQNHSIVAVEDGQLIGVMGATPMRFKAQSGDRNGAALTTWVVSEAARGKGVGVQILRHLQDQYDVLLGAGISGPALPLYYAAQFTYLRAVQRYVYISNDAKARNFTEISERDARIARSRNVELGATKTLRDACLASDLGVLDANASHMSFTRHADFLRWRYEAHPAFTYEAFRTQDGGGVVLREDRVNGTRFVHVVELLGPPRSFAASLEFIEREAIARDAAFVDFSCTHAAPQAALRARGWISALDDPFIQMPNLFHPPEYRDPASTSLVLWAKGGEVEMYDFSSLYFTRGDLDLDRPTLSWYESQGT